MKTFASLIAGAMLVVSASASAQATKPNLGVYVGIDGGFANAKIDDAPSGYRVTSESKNAGLLRGALGYQFTPNFALEAGYFGTGDFKQSAANGASSYDIKASVSGADFSAIYKFTEGVPGLFLKGGVTYSKVDVSATARSGSAASSSAGSQSGSGYLLGFGYEYDFTQNWSANLSYTRLPRVGGDSESNLNLLAAGVKYRF